jgi:hypothetical protein
MQFENFKILTIEVENQGLVKILSISELPKDRLFLLQQTTTPMEMLEKSFELVELALLNPAQAEIFKEMSPSQFYQFYRTWTFKSRMLDEEERMKEEWNYGEED